MISAYWLIPAFIAGGLCMVALAAILHVSDIERAEEEYGEWDKDQPPETKI